MENLAEVRVSIPEYMTMNAGAGSSEAIPVDLYIDSRDPHIVRECQTRHARASAGTQESRQEDTKRQAER